MIGVKLGDVQCRGKVATLNQDMVSFHPSRNATMGCERESRFVLFPDFSGSSSTATRGRINASSQSRNKTAKCYQKQQQIPYSVLQIALRRRYIEPAMHREHAHVEAIQLESGTEALAHSFSAEGERAQQPDLKQTRDAGAPTALARHSCPLSTHRQLHLITHRCEAHANNRLVHHAPENEIGTCARGMNRISVVIIGCGV
jgi:hypothetical protein